MQMTFRWFGKELDTVSLKQIKQIPNVVGVVPALHDLPAGEAWTLDRVQKMYVCSGPVKHRHKIVANTFNTYFCKISDRCFIVFVPNKYNGITLCTGSLGASPKNDLVDMIKDPVIGERIYFGCYILVFFKKLFNLAHSFAFPAGHCIAV